MQPDAEVLAIKGNSFVKRGNFYFEVTILTDIAPVNSVSTEELVGPALSLYLVHDENAAVDLAKVFSSRAPCNRAGFPHARRRPPFASKT